ncbi:UbiH/UbiF family hydroxylase [Kaistia dalseonensis]|uniref:2-octaprenyl-6-methoxyphenol hydroxylase n=1 Tax=Kaistia dalseonensis TaxID=410840 RepID=A0ABU0H2K6_9HYPH|nr:UbiH/UbiF family hydroxylase [Kaistia dalseonensis]MCX5493960.1 UbiH/UbiF family hydroxylase [Kaistia dalseonensis]MDQ0436536.1 2-octaprenyl-6-methoxyphenol hydroxylase [Kaistia dalseonensis]
MTQEHASRHDVVVVGAGPAGLVAALLAARKGADVAVLAPASPPRDQRTVAMLGVSVDLLKEAGIWGAIEAKASPLRTMRIVDATRRLVRAPLVEFHAGEIGREAFGYNIPNGDLVAALEDAARAAGIARYFGVADDFRVGDAHVEIVASDGGVITTKLVGAADGRNSKARDAAGLPVRRWSYRQAALVVNIAHALPHDDTSTEFHTETGPFTLVPLPGLHSAVVCVERPEEAERLSKLDDEALALEFERRSHALLGRIRIDGSRQVFPLSGQTARHFAARRIALIGEAAHVFPPIGAQGLNLGLRDAAVFAGVVGDHLADPGASEALAAYDRQRTGDILSRTTAVDALNRTLLTGFLPVQMMRGIGLFALDRVPMLKRAVMRQGLAPHL